MADPTYHYAVTVADTVGGGDFSDAKQQLDFTLSDRVGARDILDKAVVGFLASSPSDRLRGYEIPDDPYFDDDGDPSTPEMMMEHGVAYYVHQVGANLYVTEGGGEIAVWEAMTLAQKCQWICNYRAPSP